MPDERARGEAELVRRCADGDEVAWSAFVDTYGPLLNGLARRMLVRRSGRAPDDQVDEVVAEVFLALIRRDRLLLRRYDPQWRLSTYLGVLCRTAVVRLLRRRRPAALERPDRVPAAAEEAEGLAALTPEERAAALETLRRGLDRLPARDRLLLSLRFLDGLDYRAIAEALDVSPESVGPLLHRAKRRLAEEIGTLEGLVSDGD